MKPKILFLLALLLSFSFALSACTGQAGIASSWPGLTVDGATGYLAYNQHIYAINLSDGTMKWRYPTEKPSAAITFYAPPAVTADGQVIVGGYDHKLYSLDAQTGIVKWIFPDATSRFLASPLVTSDRIYAVSADGSLFALDMTGAKKWEAPFKAGGALWAQPVFDPQCNCLYLPAMDRRLYAVDATSGKLLWKTDDLKGSMVGTPAYGTDGSLYIGTFANELLKLDAKTGSILWQVPTEAWVWSGPALDGELLYFGDLKGNFYVVNAADGSLVKKIAPDAVDITAIVGTPLVTADHVFFTTEAGNVYTVRKDDYSRRSQNFKGKLYAPAVGSGDLVLVTPTESDAILIALNLDLSQKWSFVPPK